MVGASDDLTGFWLSNLSTLFVEAAGGDHTAALGMSRMRFGTREVF